MWLKIAYERGSIMGYKKYTLEPTDENILKSIKEDTFKRSDDIKNFIEGLDMIESNVFIGLDARWGEGKTFFVRQIETTLKYLYKKRFNLEEKKSDSNKKEINDAFSNSILRNIELKKLYKPIYYNAWLYDYHNDPLISLLHVLIKKSGKCISTEIDSKKISEKLISIVSSFSLSIPFLEVNFENLNENDILEEIKTAEDIRETVKEILNEIIVENTEKLVIFIDELDRCRPDFAIAILERMKHYFDDDRIIFVVSVNKEQLIHTISKYYGEQFDSTAYLNKFFDINMHLPVISKQLKKSIITKSKNNQSNLENIVGELSEYYNLSLRDTMIFKQNVESSLKKYYNDHTIEGRLLSMFVPIILVLDIVNQEKKYQFLEGKGDIFEEICANLPSFKTVICEFSLNNLVNDENLEFWFEKINIAYKECFSNKTYDSKFNFKRNLKKICISVCNEL